MKKINILIIFTLLLNLPALKSLLFAEEIFIEVLSQEELGAVNKKIFGTNFIAYDPATYESWAKEYYGYSDYGAGAWDPQAKDYVKEVVDLAKNSGVSIIRFPGGCGAHQYNWKNTIGANRQHFLFGVDEFLKTAEAIQAETVFTVSYFTGNANDAADLVEYLNSPADGSNPNGGIDWAAERAKNSHPEAYGVKYFEIGNEDWHGDHRTIKKVTPVDYANRYLKYYQAMKSVDPTIQIGAILCLPEWDNQVLAIIKQNLDFGIVHLYPAPPGNINTWKKMTPKEIFETTLKLPKKQYYQDAISLLKTLQETAGRKIPLAITEYNFGLADDAPLAYRHALGAALVNAELLSIFLQPGSEVLMANYWQFSNSHWGMIYAADGSYVKRPNYYVYELYHQHFGDTLIQNTLDTPSQGLTVVTSKSADTVYLMVLNKNMTKDIFCKIQLKDFSPGQKAKAWVLNGPAVEATNENNAETVRVNNYEIELQKNELSYLFPAHSLTAIEIKGKFNEN